MVLRPGSSPGAGPASTASATGTRKLRCVGTPVWPSKWKQEQHMNWDMHEGKHVSCACTRQQPALLARLGQGPGTARGHTHRERRRAQSSPEARSSSSCLQSIGIDDRHVECCPARAGEQSKLQEAADGRNGGGKHWYPRSAPAKGLDLLVTALSSYRGRRALTSLCLPNGAAAGSSGQRPRPCTPARRTYKPHNLPVHALTVNEAPESCPALLGDLSAGGKA